MRPICTWVLKTSQEHPPRGLYCGAEVRFKIVRDDDGRAVRKYDSLCPEHRAAEDAVRRCEWCGEPIDENGDYAAQFKPGRPRFCGQACADSWAYQGDDRF